MRKQRKARKPVSGRKPESNNFKDKDRLTDTGGLSKADRADERNMRDCYASKANAPEWYAQNAQLMKDYASFPFGFPLGTTSQEEALLYRDASVPGVMAFYYGPSVGTSQDETSAVNIAMRSIYTYVRHVNSGHTNYEAPDLMIYLLAMDSVYMYLAYLKRLYGVLFDYSPLNRYYPEALITAMGVNPADIREHIVDLRGFINQFAVRAGSFCVPNSMSYMARHSWMAEGLYTDSMSARAQTYLYVPATYFQFVEKGSSTTDAGSLTSVHPFTQPAFWSSPSVSSNVSQLLTFEQLVTFGNSLLNPLIVSEDMNIMSGDILKAFGTEGIVKITGIDEGYSILPVYSQEVLSQIENMTIFNADVTQTVEQNTSIGGGYLIGYMNCASKIIGLPKWQPTTFGQYLKAARFLNFHHDAVSPEDVMVATRLMATATLQFDTSDANITKFQVFPQFCGSEFVTSAVVFMYANSGADKTLFCDRIATEYDVVQQAESLQNAFSVAKELTYRAQQVAQFDWHPHIYFMYWNANSPSDIAADDRVYLPFADLDNYTVITPQNLRRLHETALLSEFSVPRVGLMS